MADFAAAFVDIEQEDKSRKRKGHDIDTMLDLDTSVVRKSARSRKPPPPKDVSNILILFSYITFHMLSKLIK